MKMSFIFFIFLNLILFTSASLPTNSDPWFGGEASLIFGSTLPTFSESLLDPVESKPDDCHLIQLKDESPLDNRTISFRQHFLLDCMASNTYVLKHTLYSDALCAKPAATILSEGSVHTASLSTCVTDTLQLLLKVHSRSTVLHSSSFRRALQVFCDKVPDRVDVPTADTVCPAFGMSLLACEPSQLVPMLVTREPSPLDPPSVLPTTLAYDPLSPYFVRIGLGQCAAHLSDVVVPCTMTPSVFLYEPFSGEDVCLVKLSAASISSGVNAAVLFIILFFFTFL